MTEASDDIACPHFFLRITVQWVPRLCKGTLWTENTYALWRRCFWVTVARCLTTFYNITKLEFLLLYKGLILSLTCTQVGAATKGKVHLYSPRGN